jgi:hypothetical protein
MWQRIKRLTLLDKRDGGPEFATTENHNGIPRPMAAQFQPKTLTSYQHVHRYDKKCKLFA